jgi:hypothetical protein
MLTIFLALALATPPDSPRAAAEAALDAVRQAKPTAACQCGPNCQCSPCQCGKDCAVYPTGFKNYEQFKLYRDSATRAKKELRPVVVFVGFVGREQRQIDGCITIYLDEFPEVRGQGIVLGCPDRHGDLWRWDLLPSASDVEIRLKAGHANVAWVAPVYRVPYEALIGYGQRRPCKT